MRTQRSWPWGRIAAVVGTGILLFALADHHHHPASEATSAAPAHASIPRKTPRTGHGPGRFTLPPPLGDARRTQPLLTEWVLDSDVLADPAFVSAFESEAPVALRYLATYALRADRLGFVPAALGSPVMADQTELGAQLADPTLLTTAATSAPIVLPAPAPHRDRAIVIVTADPAAWAQAIPAGPIPAPATVGAHRSKTRWFVLDVVPGSGPHTDATLAGAGEPQRLTVDPRSLGDLARALARVFVDATGALWSVTNSAPGAVSG